MNKRPHPLLALLATVTLLLAAPATAQSDPLEVTLVPYLVSVVTLDDGRSEEQLAAADAALPGQTIEYLLTVRNVSDEALPAGTVTLVGPVPGNTRFLAESAVTEASAQTAYSADGEAFAEPPVTIVVVDDDGDEQEVVVEPADYRAVRWNLLEPVEPGETLEFRFRVVVE